LFSDDQYIKDSTPWSSNARRCKMKRSSVILPWEFS
jgi:hypothetical protein